MHGMHFVLGAIDWAFLTSFNKRRPFLAEKWPHQVSSGSSSSKTWQSNPWAAPSNLLKFHQLRNTFQQTLCTFFAEQILENAKLPSISHPVAKFKDSSDSLSHVIDRDKLRWDKFGRKKNAFAIDPKRRVFIRNFHKTIEKSFKKVI